MAKASGTSTSSWSGRLRYAPFALDVCLNHYKDYLETGRFNAMISNSDVKKVYDARNGLDRDTALKA